MIESGSVPCDAVALAVVVQVEPDAVSSRDPGPAIEHATRILELNGGFVGAEAVFRARIEADANAPDPYVWRACARFLARRGRGEEALLKFETAPMFVGRCGLALDHDSPDLYRWIKVCSQRLHGSPCRAQEWDATRQRAPHPGDAFVAPHIPIEFDVARRKRTFDADDVAREVATARQYRERNHSDSHRALRAAADSGLPVAGYAVLEFVGSREERCRDRDRRLTFDRWCRGLWRRTFGHGNPEDPTTW